MDVNSEQSDLSESVEEMKTKLEAMKRMIDINEAELRKRKNRSSYKASIIDGNFLSMVFVIVLSIILLVTFYAFFNLFTAVKKKYTGQHSEL